MTSHRRALLAWLVVGAAGFLVLPWYALQDSVLGVAWLRDDMPNQGIDQEAANFVE